MMIRRNTLLVKILLGAALTSMVGCTCKTEMNREKVRKKTRRVKRVRMGKPKIFLKKEMAEIMKLTVEVQRRARAGLPLLAPARMLKNAGSKLNDRPLPESFKTRNRAWIEAVTALERTKNHGRDFNAMLHKCISCHAAFAKNRVQVLLPLRLPDTPPGTPKPAATTNREPNDPGAEKQKEGSEE